MKKLADISLFESLYTPSQVSCFNTTLETSKPMLTDEELAQTYLYLINYMHPDMATCYILSTYDLSSQDIKRAVSKYRDILIDIEEDQKAAREDRRERMRVERLYADGHMVPEPGKQNVGVYRRNQYKRG